MFCFWIIDSDLGELRYFTSLFTMLSLTLWNGTHEYQSKCQLAHTNPAGLLLLHLHVLLYMQKG